MRDTNEILTSLLLKRGIVSEEDISEFLSDRPKKTYDPFLLLNMEAGVDLLLSEIKEGTKLCIYGDYDADGVTSVCILSSVIKNLTDNFIHYIPSRFEEGYGLNESAVRKLAEEGVGIIVTVDCGSVSYREVELAKELRIKVIVTDHHRIDDRRADCLLINPKQEECSYPFKELAGCGVAFKMAQAIQQKANLPKKVINNVLDLVAVGTVGDVVSLTDENRTLVKYGLNKINSGNNLSLKKLGQEISLSWITSENIAFGIVPHINAAGRMEDANEAVKLFLSEKKDEIDEQVGKLIKFNHERKERQEKAFKEGIEMVDGNDDFIILYMPDIHEGVGGIVAGKIKEHFNRPTVIVTPSGEGYFKGTGRSIDSVDIYSLLKKHIRYFEKFGGHRSACGFLMKEENLPLLKKAVKEEMKILKENDPHVFDIELCWDMELAPEEVTVCLAEIMEKLEPCGQGNAKPVFLLKNVRIVNMVFMGDDSSHARFTALSAEGKGAECVLFRKAQEKKDVLSGRDCVDIMGSLSVQTWRGTKKVQFIVEEIIKNGTR